MDTPTRTLALWGPPTSGKTWLIEALIYQIHRLNKPADKAFDFRLYDRVIDTSVPFRDPSMHGATQVQKDNTWQLTRRALHLGAGYQLSSHTHALEVRDHAGQATLQMLTETWKARQTDSSIVTADCVWVMLDHTLLSNAATPSATATFSQADYTTHLEQLLERLHTHEKAPPERWVAVCLSKADLLPAPKTSPWELLRDYFGDKMASLLTDYAQKDRFHLEVFPLSAVGFLDTAEPNQADHALKDPQRWEPWRVETPLFWLLETLERRRLQQNGNGLMRFLFRHARQQNYLTYPSITKL